MKNGRNFGDFSSASETNVLFLLFFIHIHSRYLNSRNPYLQKKIIIVKNNFPLPLLVIISVKNTCLTSKGTL